MGLGLGSEGLVRVTLGNVYVMSQGYEDLRVRVCVCVSGQRASADEPDGLQPGADPPGQTGEAKEIQGEDSRTKNCGKLPNR